MNDSTRPATRYTSFLRPWWPPQTIYPVSRLPPTRLKLKQRLVIRADNKQVEIRTDEVVPNFGHDDAVLQVVVSEHVPAVGVVPRVVDHRLLAAVPRVFQAYHTGGEALLQPLRLLPVHLSRQLDVGQESVWRRRYQFRFSHWFYIRGKVTSVPYQHLHCEINTIIISHGSIHCHRSFGLKEF